MQATNPREVESKPHPIRRGLWWIVLSPMVWAFHFLACYVTVAIYCEKFSSNSHHEWLWCLIGGYTAVAVAAIGVIACRSFRGFRQADPPLPYDFDDPSDRTHFIRFTAFLLSLLSLIATLFTALALLIVRSCD